MTNADIFVEVIRLGEQIGMVSDSHMYAGDYFTVEGKTRDGKKFTLSLTMREENKDA